MNISADLSLPQQAQYLQTLPAIHERCGRVLDLVKQGKLQYLDYHADKDGVITEFCSRIIAQDFGTNYDKVPPQDWAYTEQSTGERYLRSEGLAVGCLHMFTEGYFSSDPEQPHQVDGTVICRF
ncbi:hypothetical protein EV421DRAFT_1033898 [Armillaria borealis]|uniref:Uncharacterized protein n=1 Tax=Armillaria borealis TaxID=47425 RepID=A0AA39JZD6_9AGAR|nr:hypothetical protein EV421DRAFT_1033898 [Armillaria borealis]